MLEQPIYRLESADEICRLVADNSWVTLVSHLSSGLEVSHLPVLVAGDEDQLAILGHLARVDAESHELGDHEVVLIVQAEHGYITPTFYSGGPYVPTWNFVVVHLYGTPQVLGPAETYDILQRTVDQYERMRPEPFRLESVEEYARLLAPHTTGFRLVPHRVVAKAKLSQEKTPVDRRGVVDGLENDPIHGNAALAARMRSYGVIG
jgi:transcriptional regulator